MGAKRKTELPAELRKVRGELEEWRGQKSKGHRIPQELWGAAVRMAHRHGLNRVSRALNLDYYQLKKRSGLSEEKAQPARAGEQMFVELARAVSDTSEPNAACVVELEKGNGVKLRVSVREASAVDWRQVKEAFLGA